MYRLPKFNDGVDRVNQYSVIESIAPARAAALSVVYGVGIKKAEVTIKTQGQEKQSAGSPYKVSDAYEQYSPDAQFNGNTASPTDRWDGKMSSSLLGMPVMCHLKFLGGDYLDLAGNLVTIPEVDLETVILTVNIRKNIKRTTISGKDSGDITEFIGMGNHDVEIRTIITADAPVNQNITKMGQLGVYPRDNMQAINSLIVAPISLKVECWFLLQFGIEYLVFDDGITIEQIEGEYSMQRITIPAYSDRPLIIKIIQ